MRTFLNFLVSLLLLATFLGTGIFLSQISKDLKWERITPPEKTE